MFKRPQISYTHEKVVNIYIDYELGTSTSHNNDPILKSCLFGAGTLTKNGHGIGFDRRLSFSFPSGRFS